MLKETLLGLLVASVSLYIPMSLYVVINQAMKLERVDKTLAFTSAMYGTCFTLRLFAIT
jgi:hypothetical protein